MSKKSKIRNQQRELQAEKKAKKIVNGVFIGLIVLIKAGKVLTTSQPLSPFSFSHHDIPPSCSLKLNTSS